MADVLYGASGGSADSSDLYILDLDVGHGQASIGPTGYAITGLAFDPTTGILYGSTSTNSAASPKSIIRLNVINGRGTLIGATGLTKPVGDITFDSTGQMYGWVAGTNGKFVTINKTTGVATEHGSSTTFGGGIESVADVLHWIPQGGGGDQLSTVNPTTGARTPIAVLTGGPGTSSSSYHGGVMYLGGFGNVYTLNLVTAAASFAYGPFISNLDAIAWGPAPPTSDAILGVSVAFYSSTFDSTPYWTRLDA